MDTTPAGAAVPTAPLPIRREVVEVLASLLEALAWGELHEIRWSLIALAAVVGEQAWAVRAQRAVSLLAATAAAVLASTAGIRRALRSEDAAGELRARVKELIAIGEDFEELASELDELGDQADTQRVRAHGVKRQILRLANALREEASGGRPVHFAPALAAETLCGHAADDVPHVRVVAGRPVTCLTCRERMREQVEAAPVTRLVDALAATIDRELAGEAVSALAVLELATAGVSAGATAEDDDLINGRCDGLNSQPPPPPAPTEAVRRILGARPGE